jgi:hypothetical protein
MHSPDVTETSFTESKKERKTIKKRGGGNDCQLQACTEQVYKAVHVGVLGIITVDYQVLSV